MWANMDSTSSKNNQNNERYWISLLTICIVAASAVGIIVYAFLKDDSMSIERLLSIVLRMIGGLSFLGFYIALGVIAYVVLMTACSSKMSREEKRIYWIFLLKRNWIFLPLFIFGNYMMMYHFVPNSKPDLSSWFFMALVEGPIFTVIIAGFLAALTCLYRRMRGKNSTL